MSRQSDSCGSSRCSPRKESSAAQQKPTNKKSLNSTLSTALSQCRKASGIVSSISKEIRDHISEGYQPLTVDSGLNLMHLCGVTVGTLEQLVSVLTDLVAAPKLRKKRTAQLRNIRKVLMELEKNHPAPASVYLTTEEVDLEEGLEAFIAMATPVEKPWEEEG